MPEPTVTISKADYEQLLRERKILHALEEAGVDNWVGYGHAISMVNVREADLVEENRDDKVL